MRQRILIVIFAFMASLSVANAQTEERLFKVNQTESENFLISFRFNKAVIDSGYMNNAALLREFARILTHTSVAIDSVAIIASGSPDGVVEYNQALAARRAKAMKRYIVWKYPFVDRYKISTTSIGENWVGMQKLLEADSHVPFKEQILQVLSADINSATKEWRLKQIDDGNTWSYISDHYLRHLRAATTCVVFYTKQGVESSKQVEPSAFMPQVSEMQTDSGAQNPPQTTKTDNHTPATGNQTHDLHGQQQMNVQQRQTEQTQIIVAQEREQSHSIEPIIGIKTDLMLWGGVMPGFKIGTWVPNLSAEVYFARRWSVQLSGAYANWNALSGEKKLYAVMSANIEGRYWFSKASIYKGFYLGLYGQYGEYDLQQMKTNQTGSFYGGGLGAGYLLPLSKHWAVEAQIRGGYRSASNDYYDIEEGHYYLNRHESVGKFVPQFKLQVVYRFGKPENRRISYE